MRFSYFSRVKGGFSKARAYVILNVGIAALAIFSLSGCSNSMSPSMMSNPRADLIKSVTPVDGETGVQLQSSISLSFNQRMDTSAVRENFHLLGGADMREWMTSSHQEQGFGHMSDNQFTNMMRQLDSREIPGTFAWSPGLKDCEFIADSAFAPQEEYMLVMYEDGMMNRFMHSMGMMGGDKNVLMYHFGTRGR